MTTPPPRRLVGLMTGLLAIGVVTAVPGMVAVAHASTTTNPIPHTSGMVLSREFTEQKAQLDHKAVRPIDQQVNQLELQPDSPAQQVKSELMGNIKAEQQDVAVMQTLNSLRNTQTMEPKAQVYALKSPVREHLGMMESGWSEVPQ